jgi:hypothetical protein
VFFYSRDRGGEHPEQHLAIDALFAIEREIKGMTPQERVRARNERSRSLVIELESWLREQGARTSKSSETGKAITIWPRSARVAC